MNTFLFYINNFPTLKLLSRKCFLYLNKIIMNLSNVLDSFIANKFHYVRLIRTGMISSRLNTCSSLKDRALTKSIKKNLHFI